MTTQSRIALFVRPFCRMSLAQLIRSYTTLEDSTVSASPIPAQIAQGELPPHAMKVCTRNRSPRSLSALAGLARKEWRLIDIVKELGEVLLSGVDPTRARGAKTRRRKGEQAGLTRDTSAGVGLLAAVVGAMDRKTLDRQSSKFLPRRLQVRPTLTRFARTTAKTLTTFFTDKLSDSPSMLSCVNALTALTECPMFGVGEGMEVARGCVAAPRFL